MARRQQAAASRYLEEWASVDGPGGYPRWTRVSTVHEYMRRARIPEEQSRERAKRHILAHFLKCPRQLHPRARVARSMLPSASSLREIIYTERTHALDLRRLPIIIDRIYMQLQRRVRASQARPCAVVLRVHVWAIREYMRLSRARITSLESSGGRDMQCLNEQAHTPIARLYDSIAAWKFTIS